MDYTEACKMAADEQGITAIVDYLTMGDIPAQTWQTGGFCMVAAVPLRWLEKDGTDDYIMVTDSRYHDGSQGWLACHYIDDQGYEPLDECEGDPATVTRWIVNHMVAARMATR